MSDLDASVCRSNASCRTHDLPTVLKCQRGFHLTRRRRCRRCPLATNQHYQNERCLSHAPPANSILRPSKSQTERWPSLGTREWCSIQFSRIRVLQCTALFCLVCAAAATIEVGPHLSVDHSKRRTFAQQSTVEFRRWRFAQGIRIVERTSCQSLGSDHRASIQLVVEAV